MNRENGQQDLFKDIPIWNEGLTGRRRLFVEYYCKDRNCFLNATAAYIKAFNNKTKELSETSIQSNASRMMRDPKIKTAIAKLLRAHQNEEDQLNEFLVLDTLKTLSFYNPKDIIDDRGYLKKPLEELGQLAMCITGIKRGRNGSVEYKLYDRTKSITLLCNYLSLIRPPEGANIINPVVYITDKDIQTKAAQDAEYEFIDAGASA